MGRRFKAFHNTNGLAMATTIPSTRRHEYSINSKNHVTSLFRRREFWRPLNSDRSMTSSFDIFSRSRNSINRHRFHRFHPPKLFSTLYPRRHPTGIPTSSVTLSHQILKLPLKRVSAKNLVSYDGETQDTSISLDTGFSGTQITELFGKYP